MLDGMEWNELTHSQNLWHGHCAGDQEHRNSYSTFTATGGSFSTNNTEKKRSREAIWLNNFALLLGEWNGMEWNIHISDV